MGLFAAQASKLEVSGGKGGAKMGNQDGASILTNFTFLQERGF